MIPTARSTLWDDAGHETQERGGRGVEDPFRLPIFWSIVGRVCKQVGNVSPNGRERERARGRSVGAMSASANPTLEEGRRKGRKKKEGKERRRGYEAGKCGGHNIFMDIT